MAGYSELFGRLGRNPQSAALLALIGTIAILLVWNFVSNVLNVPRGADAPVALFSSSSMRLVASVWLLSFICSIERSGSRGLGEEARVDTLLEIRL